MLLSEVGSKLEFILDGQQDTPALLVPFGVHSFLFKRIGSKHNLVFARRELDEVDKFIRLRGCNLTSRHASVGVSLITQKSELASTNLTISVAYV